MTLKATMRWTLTNKGWAVVYLDDLLVILENMREANIPLDDLISELGRLKQQEPTDE